MLTAFDCPVMIETVAEPDFVGSALLVAVTVAVVLLLTVGLLYMPVLEIVPSLADHFTATSEVLLTSALNCMEPVDGTVAVPGVTFTTIPAPVFSKTAVWNGCAPSLPLASCTRIPKLKVPALLGFPESVPLAAPSINPFGSCPHPSENW